MEIFKVANQNVEASLATTVQESSQTRQIEQTQIRPDVVEDKQELSQEDMVKMINEATNKLNDNMEALDTSVRFAYNDKIQALYVDVMDSKTGNIIRKIPNEQIIKLSEYFREAIGVLFDKKG
ncbi:flagellar protein FlaG [Campylobacter sp. faydin G-24]|uniref:Flagellar protein FlaG n=1 Tax=Campylobacter anatolicus TaxID=2829105 RepID=A0ABS5HIJ5_9BACT|nr:FlaG family protein [Campylobacter anatolicus]MBR8462744.1 flagellar protein FlaG [Campylobacter anatolicus]MBR8464089.1 flagellar protein FlaG [Campylobacter anatolicus]MBR8465994.1 flagellar protein FlaG [Campylobacter anatolicus]